MKRAHEPAPPPADRTAGLADTLNTVAAGPPADNDAHEPHPFFRDLRDTRETGATGICWRQLKQVAPSMPLKLCELDNLTAGIEAVAMVLSAGEAARHDAEWDDQLGGYVTAGLFHALVMLSNQARNTVFELGKGLKGSME